MSATSSAPSVLLEVLAALRARDRHDVVALREHPRERELRGRAALLRRRSPARARRGRGSSRSSRPGSAAGSGGSRRRARSSKRLICAGQEAAAERAVGDEADAELAARRRGRRPRGRASRASTRSAARRSGAPRGARASVAGAGLGEAEVAHLARAHELRHRADRLLDRHVGIDAVLVVEVDRARRRAASRLASQDCAHVLGPAVDAADAGVRRIAHDAELRREDDAGRAGRGSRGRPAPRCCTGRTCRRCRGS